jgi:hypothetical protein
MEIGMLWFDNDQKTSVPRKVERAARYYQEKYGVDPNLCYVHPRMVSGENGGKSKKSARQEKLTVGQILVLMSDNVLPDHFWIGVRTAEDPVS